MTYRILVTGSRTWRDHDLVRDALAMAIYQNLPAVIVHGACPSGADAIASWWVRQIGRNLDVTQRRHPAPWYAPCRPECAHGPRPKDRAGVTYCPAAGQYRNQAMVQHGADLCLAFLMPCTKKYCTKPKPHGSHGASDCADLAENAGIETKRYPADSPHRKA